MKPLCIDLYCGLGGWTEGFLSEGFDVIGFDIEQHVYGEHRYPAQLVLQDVRTLHGRQFKDADIIVASSPCQKYSYMAMPWKRAKEQAKWYRDPLYPERLIELNELFDQPKRIQREACEAAGRYIPLVQENVRGAISWVGRSQWHYGSYHLWGDVPALMPIPHRGQKFNPDGTAHPPGSWFAIADSANRGVKVGGFSWSDYGKPGYVGKALNTEAERATKNTGGSWFNVGSPGQKVTNQNPVHDGVKQHGSGAEWFDSGICKAASKSSARKAASKSSARKAASARIAKIPFPLSQWIARVTREALTGERAA